jgi:hypothetical protein
VPHTEDTGTAASVAISATQSWPDENAKRSYLRNKFLDAVSQHAPEVCNALHDGPFQLYLEIKNEIGLEEWKRHPYDVTSQFEKHPKICGLYESLVGCLRTYNLYSAWSYELAGLTLRRWSRLKKSVLKDKPPSQWGWAKGGAGGELPDIPPPPDGWPEYEPWLFSRRDYVLQAIVDHQLLKRGRRSQKTRFAHKLFLQRKRREHSSSLTATPCQGRSATVRV